MQEAKEIIQQVKNIEISTKRLVDGLIAGNYHSVFLGQGMEFSQIREYMPGDDIRSIDWNVTARLNRPFVKEFSEERDLNVYFAFDISGSGQFGSDVSKRRKALELTSSLMFSALRNNDNVGLLLFSDDVEKFTFARKGKKHVLKLITTLITHKSKSKNTSIDTALAYLSKVIKKRSIIFIVSDFFSKDFTKPLKVLRNKHDVIAVNIYDERENAIPDVGLIELEDEETDEQILVDTSDAGFRARYREMISKERNSLQKALRKLKVDMLDISTDKPYEVPLRNFFRQRQHRVVR